MVALISVIFPRTGVLLLSTSFHSVMGWKRGGRFSSFPFDLLAMEPSVHG